MKFFSIFLSSALLFSGLCYGAGPAVLVKHNDKYQGFMQLPRLADVVVGVNNSADLYWPAARFYKTSPDDVIAVEQQRQQVLQQLKQLQQWYLQDHQDELATSTELVLLDIQSWQLAKQLLLPLDPDRVRVKAQLNPKLIAGQYLLVVGPRPEAVQLIGFTKTKKLPVLNAASAADYLGKIDPLEGASSSFLYITPAGSATLLAETGMWNNKPQDVPPGALLFVPIEQRLLPSEFENLNKQIIELAQHKVVLE